MRTKSIILWRNKNLFDSVHSSTEDLISKQIEWIFSFDWMTDRDINSSGKSLNHILSIHELWINYMKLDTHT